MRRLGPVSALQIQDRDAAAGGFNKGAIAGLGDYRVDTGEQIDKIQATQPDYVLILPWNFKEEIMQQLAYIRTWGAQFVVPIPEVNVV